MCALHRAARHPQGRKDCAVSQICKSGTGIVADGEQQHQR
jgi:hypothetical protein